MAADSRPPRAPLPPLASDEEGGASRAAREAPPRDPPPPSRPGRRPTEDGRRLWSAGHALLVALLALGIGVLLNAPGIHKDAYNLSSGWERDLALAFTGPLSTVSHALYLDRPRAGLQAAIGRSGEDEIDVEIALPPAAAPTPPPAAREPAPQPEPKAKPKPEPNAKPAPPAKLAFTPQKKLRLWIAGDSLVITPGYAIVRAAGASPVIDPVGDVQGRVSTGLQRPDVFNWFSEIASQMKALKPKAVVLAFGGNDDKAYMTGLPEGVSIGDFGSAAWQQEYRRRVAGIMNTVTRAGAHLIWIGLPITRSPEQTRRYDVVNAAVVKEAQRRPRTVTYIDTYSLFASESGGYSDYRTTVSGERERVRAADGVHFDVAGGNLIAREVLRHLNRVYDLTSWRSKQKTP